MFNNNYSLLTQHFLRIELNVSREKKWQRMITFLLNIMRSHYMNALHSVKTKQSGIWKMKDKTRIYNVYFGIEMRGGEKGIENYHKLRISN